MTENDVNGYDLELAASLHAEGWALRRIARELGIPYSRVRRELLGEAEREKQRAWSRGWKREHLGQPGLPKRGAYVP